MKATGGELRLGEQSGVVRNGYGLSCAGAQGLNGLPGYGAAGDGELDGLARELFAIIGSGHDPDEPRKGLGRHQPRHAFPKLGEAEIQAGEQIAARTGNDNEIGHRPLCDLGRDHLVALDAEGVRADRRHPVVGDGEGALLHATGKMTPARHAVGKADDRSRHGLRWRGDSFQAARRSSRFRLEFRRAPRRPPPKARHCRSRPRRPASRRDPARAPTAARSSGPCASRWDCTIRASTKAGRCRVPPRASASRPAVFRLRRARARPDRAARYLRIPACRRAEDWKHGPRSRSAGNPRHDPRQATPADSAGRSCRPGGTSRQRLSERTWAKVLCRRTIWSNLSFWACYSLVIWGQA